MGEIISMRVSENNEMFYIKFISKEAKKEFDEMVEMFNRNEVQLRLGKCRNASYDVEVSKVDGCDSIFAIVLHKYMSMDKQLVKDEMGNKVKIINLQYPAKVWIA